MSEGKDLTKGNLLSNMIKFCLPLLITNLLDSIYNIVDGIWIGRLVGDSGLSATTNCWPIMLVAYSFLAGITVTTSIMVAQHFASKDREKIKEVITPLYIISVIMGIFTAVLLWITEDFWFNLFNTPIEVIPEAKAYISMYLIGFIFNFLGFTMVSGMRAIGNSKTPLKILAATEIANIVLDPIFIKMGYGVKGAAIATAVSMLLSVVLSFLCVRKSDLLKFDIKYIKFSKEFLKQASKLGIPMIIQQVTTIFTIMLEVNISNSLGVVGGSTYGIVSKFQEVVWVLGNAINELITVVVGQFVGKNEFNRIKDVMKNGLKLIIAPIVVIAVFVIFGSEIFAKIFTNNKEVILSTIEYMHVVGVGYTFVPLCQLLYGMVLGLGNTRFSFITSTAATIAEIVIAIYLNNTTHRVFFSLGVGITAWYLVEIVMFAIYYFSKRWYKTENKVA